MGHTIIPIPVKGANAYLIKSENGFLLVDTGSSANIRVFKDALKKAGGTLADIKAIVITHAHYDHVGNVKQLKMESGAYVIINAQEQSLLEKGFTTIPNGTSNIFKLIVFFARKFASSQSYFPAVTPDITFKTEYDLEPFGFSAKVIHTPGHTTGSSSVLVDGDKCICGDMCFNIMPNSVYPVFANDTEQLHATLKALQEYDIQEFFPGHGKKFGKDKLTKTVSKIK